MCMKIFKLNKLTDDVWVTRRNINHIICGGDSRFGGTCIRFRRFPKQCDLLGNFRLLYGPVFEVKELALIFLNEKLASYL